LEWDSTLRIPDTVDSETIDRLLNYLQEKGFTGEMEQTEDRQIITVPKDTFTEQALANLQKMVVTKRLCSPRHLLRKSYAKHR